MAFTIVHTAITLTNFPVSVPFFRALRIWCGVKLRAGLVVVMCFLIAWMLEPLRSFRALMASNTICGNTVGEKVTV